MNTVPRKFYPVVAVAACLIGLAAHGQTPDLATIAEQLTALQAEVRAARAENAALRQELGLVAQKVAHATPPPATAAAVAEIAPAIDVRDHYPQIDFHVLGDITYSRSNEAGAHNTFALGDLDPVITARLSDRSSVLGDFVVAGDQHGFAFETERLIVQYRLNDSFNFSAGRFHTMIGYYNNTYHNGTFFQTAVDRPSIYDFEDGGGILPVHSNGISMDGDIPSGGIRLHYVAEIANGRNYSPGAAPFAIEDVDGQKALNFALFARPEAIPGLQIGGSIYRDSVRPSGLPDVQQTILSAYAVFKNRTWEWLNEFVVMRDAVDAGKTFNTENFYTQISRRFGLFRPYLRLEWRYTALADPLIAVLEQNDSFRTQTAGVRYDFSPMMALKAEIEHNTYDHADSTTRETLQLTFRY